MPELLNVERLSKRFPVAGARGAHRHDGNNFLGVDRVESGVDAFRQAPMKRAVNGPDLSGERPKLINVINNARPAADNGEPFADISNRTDLGKIEKARSPLVPPKFGFGRVA